MRKFKKALCAFLIVCMILPMSVATVTAGTYGEVSGAGTLVGDDGAWYTFEGLSQAQSTDDGAWIGSDYKTTAGIELYVYADRYKLTNGEGGTLLATDNKENGDNYLQLTFRGGFGYPQNQWNDSKFYDITAIAIRYRILKNTLNVGGTGTLHADGNTGTSADCKAFVIPQNGVWVEKVYAMQGNGAGNGFGMKNSPDGRGNNGFKFPELSSGASIEIAYIGFYHSVEAAQAAHGLPGVSLASGTYYKAQTTTLTPVTGTVIYYTLDGSDPTSETSTRKEVAAATPVEITQNTILKVTAKDADGNYTAVETYNYFFSPDVTYTYVDYNDPDLDDTQRTKAYVIRFDGVSWSDGFYFNTASGVGLNSDNGTNGSSQNPFTNDADGNLVIKRTVATSWDTTLCISNAEAMNSTLSTVIEVRYKIIGSDGVAKKATDLTEKVSISAMTDEASNVTADDGNDWLVTRITYNSNTWNKFTQLWNLNIPNDEVGGTIVIDYIGFFRDATVADAHAKFESVCEQDSVKLYGAQAKVGGSGVRFVGVIDDFENTVYEEFGFKIQVGDQIVDGKITNYVYTSILADGDTVNTESIPAGFVSGQGENTKFFTFCVNDIPTSALVDGSITFTVCAYAKINGTAAYGAPTAYVYTPATNTLVKA